MTKLTWNSNNKARKTIITKEGEVILIIITIIISNTETIITFRTKSGDKINIKMTFNSLLKSRQTKFTNRTNLLIKVGIKKIGYKRNKIKYKII